jgi:hypothetical protein
VPLSADIHRPISVMTRVPAPGAVNFCALEYPAVRLYVAEPYLSVGVAVTNPFALEGAAVALGVALGVSDGVTEGVSDGDPGEATAPDASIGLPASSRIGLPCSSRM